MRTTIALVLLAIAAFAQNPPAEKKPEPARSSRAFEVKPGNAERIGSALNSLGASVRWSRDASLIVVQADPELMPAMEQVVRRLDASAPPVDRNLELTVYLVQASQQAGAEASVPADVAPVIKQLKSIFAYQSYRLLDTLLLRSREGQEANTSGVLTSGASQPTARDAGPYNLGFRGTVRGEGKDRVIRIDRLRFNARVPVPVGENQFNFHDAMIQADLDIKEGQKVVVGKSSTLGSERAIILVLTGKVVE